MSILDDAADAVTNIDPPGGIDEAARRQFDNQSGGGFIDGYQDYAGDVYSPVTETASQTAQNAADTVTSVGPDWLDEAAIALVVLVVLGVGLYLLRPVLGIAENYTE